MFLTYGILYHVPISPWHLEAPSVFRFTDSQMKKNFSINYNFSPKCIWVIWGLEDMLDFGVDSGTSSDICEWVDRIYFACKIDIHLRVLKRETLDRMSLSHSNFCVESLTLNMMVLRGRAFERWLGQEVSALLVIDVYQNLWDVYSETICYEVKKIPVPGIGCLPTSCWSERPRHSLKQDRVFPLLLVVHYN